MTCLSLAALVLAASAAHEVPAYADLPLNQHTQLTHVSDFVGVLMETN